MKAIQKELGEMDDAPNEIDELQNKIVEAKMSDEASEKANAELNKLKMMSPMSAEASVVRGYIDWLVGLPWAKRSKVKHDIKRAQSILDQDHYGLEEVKDRILEYLAVQKRVRKLKGLFFAWLDLRVWVRRRWVSLLRSLLIESSFGWHLAVFVMKRRFADIEGLILAQCPVS